MQRSFFPHGICIETRFFCGIFFFIEHIFRFVTNFSFFNVPNVYNRNVKNLIGNALGKINEFLIKTTLLYFYAYQTVFFKHWKKPPSQKEIKFCGSKTGNQKKTQIFFQL